MFCFSLEKHFGLKVIKKKNNLMHAVKIEILFIVKTGVFVCSIYISKKKKKNNTYFS